MPAAKPITVNADVTAGDLSEARAEDGRTVNERWFVGTIVALAWIASFGWALRRFALAALDEPTGLVAWLVDAESRGLRPAGWAAAAIAVLLLGAVAWWLWGRIVRRLRGEPRYVSRWAEGPTRYRISRERGIEVTNSSGRWSVPWRAVNGFQETRNLILLRSMDRTQFFIPKRALGDDLDAAMDLMSRSIALRKNLSVIVCNHVLSGTPVRLVELENDGWTLDWQFLCGAGGHQSEDAAIAGLGDVLKRDPSLEEPVEALFPDGGSAERERVGAAWRYAPASLDDS